MENIKTSSLSVFLQPEVAIRKVEANNVQQELAYTSLQDLTAAVEKWYIPDPTTTIIKGDSVFVSALMRMLKLLKLHFTVNHFTMIVPLADRRNDIPRGDDESHPLPDARPMQGQTPVVQNSPW